MSHQREMERFVPILNCTEAWNIYSRGFKVGVDPLNYNFPVLMLQLISIFVVSRTLHFFLRSLKQPRFVCDILAAIIIGPSVLGKTKMFKDNSVLFPPNEIPLLHMMSTIGTIYFIFLIAVKLNISMILRTSGKKVWSVGISSIMVPLLIAGCFYFIVKLVNRYVPVFQLDPEMLEVSLLLSMTAFTHVAQLLDEINLLTSELGQLAMSCAVVNDTVRMLILMVIVIVREIKAYGFLRAIIFLTVAIIVTIFVLRPLPIWIIKRTPEGKPVKEVYIIAMLIVALVLAGLTEKAVGSPAIGAMFFGLIIPDGPPLGSTLVQKTEFIILEFLQPLIFVFIGFDTDLFSIKNWKLFGTYLLFVAVVCAGKIAGTMLPASLIYKMSYKNALSLSLAMNIKGVIEATGFQSWKHRKRIDDQSYNTLILSITAVTAFVTPLLTSSHKPRERLRGSTKHRIRTLQFATTVGELRILLCIHEEESVGSIINLLEASNPTDTCPINIYAIHLIELVGRDAPIFLPYRKGEHMSKSSDSTRIMRAFARYSKHTCNRVTIQPFTLVAPFKNMHEYICRVAQDNSIPLIIVPVRKEGCQANALRKLNSTIQDYAPCSAGILVNNGLNNDQMMRHKCFSYRVLVIFLGGADDREALAYGIRMSGHPNVSVTVLRVLIMTDQDDVESRTIERRVEKKLDDSLIDDFKQNNNNNMKDKGHGLYHEEAVEDIVHAISFILSLENDYDLVMVGRRRVINKMFEKEMEVWSENPELGVIGDALVSSDSLGGMVSVLVIQHYGEFVTPLSHS